MHSSGGHTKIHCSGHCHDCSLFDAAPGAPDAWTGWRFALAAVLTFLLPLVCAIAAGVLIRVNTHLQFAGVIGGLILGALLGRTLLCLIPPNPRAKPCPLP